jgi:hypothetical protein
MKKLSRIIFGRTFFLILALLLQTGVLFLMLAKFSSFLIVYYGFSAIISLLMCAYVANLDMNPNMRMSWITVIMAMPMTLDDYNEEVKSPMDIIILFYSKMIEKGLKNIDDVPNSFRTLIINKGL